MSTLSVPLTPELEKFVDDLVTVGYGSNKADVVRRAIRTVAEEEAVRAILSASKEPTLKGDLKELAEKII